MSGIFGYFDPDGQLPAQTATRMARALAVSPDDSVCLHRARGRCIGVVDKGVYRGASHVLSDVASQRWAVIQGEILGFQGEAKDVDRPTPGASPEDNARRLLLAPLDDDYLTRAKGPFSAAVIDTSAEGITIVCDRYGQQLVYVARVGRGTLFASQIKAILATGCVPTRLDETATALMLTIGEVAGDRTLIEGIRALPAGSVTQLGREGPETRTYWRYAFGEDPSLDFGATAQRAGRLLRQSVTYLWHTREDLAVPLSGGLDSRMLAASLPEPSRVPAYTWGIEGCRDLAYAHQVAEALGMPHHRYAYDGGYVARFGERGAWLTEGTCDLTNMHVVPYVEQVHRGGAMLLDGLAGGGVLGGGFIKKDWWQAANPADAARALWQWRAGMLSDEAAQQLFEPGRYREHAERARLFFSHVYESYDADDEMDRAMAFLLDNRIRRFTCNGVHLFRWRCEAHFPFFDHDFFDLIARVPHAWRYRHRLYVELIRREFARMGRIRWERTALPARARWPARFVSAAFHRLNGKLAQRLPALDLCPHRHVSRFDMWMRGPLRSWVEGILLDERTLDRGQVRPDGVRAVLRDHMTGRADHARLIGVLLGLEFFTRLFIDDLEGAIDRFNVAINLPAEYSGSLADQT